MLTESAARWLLVLHTALGVAAVGAATHLVLWLRRYLRGDFGRHRAVHRFAWLLVALQAGAFLAGTLMYPTYKVEVRAAYLENATAVASDYTARQRAIEHVEAREHARLTVAVADERARPARRAGLPLVRRQGALGRARADRVAPRSSSSSRSGIPAATAARSRPIVLGLAGIAAGTVWLAALIGVLTASWRAV